MAPACDRLRGRLPTGQVIADRAYDSESLHDLVLEQSGEAVIPPRRHRESQHSYDRLAYAQRWASRVPSPASKQWRHTATRYDKLADNFLASSISPATCSA